MLLIIDSFKCKLSPDDKLIDKSLNLNSDYIIILSGDTFILFQYLIPLTDNKAKIVFWSNILSITDIQMNKSKKTVSINFYEDIENQDYHLKLIIDNIIIFRDTLVSRMNALDVRVVSKMIDPMKQLKKRITLKDMTRMKLEDIETSAKELKKIIEKGEVDSYTVNTFTTLCGKAIEELNKNNDDTKQVEFMNMMKDVLQMEQVSKLTEMERNKNNIDIINKDNSKKDNINNIIIGDDKNVKNIINDEKEKIKEKDDKDDRNVSDKDNKENKDNDNKENKDTKDNKEQDKIINEIKDEDKNDKK